MREPNFIRPKRSPVCDRLALAHAADDAARQHAHHLAEHHRAALALDPQLGALVLGAGLGAVGGQEAARLIGDAGQRAPVRDAVDVDVHRRQEDADLLPVPGGGDRRLAGAGHHHPPVGRREHRPGRRPATTRSGSRKKKPRKAASSTNGIAHHQPRAEPGGHRRQHQRAADEGAPARSIPIMVWWSRARATGPEHSPARGGGSWRVQDAGAATRDAGWSVQTPTRSSAPRPAGAGCPPSGPSAAACASSAWILRPARDRRGGTAPPADATERPVRGGVPSSARNSSSVCSSCLRSPLSSDSAMPDLLCPRPRAGPLVHGNETGFRRAICLGRLYHPTPGDSTGRCDIRISGQTTAGRRGCATARGHLRSARGSRPCRTPAKAKPNRS